MPACAPHRALTSSDNRDRVWAANVSYWGRADSPPAGSARTRPFRRTEFIPFEPTGTESPSDWADRNGLSGRNKPLPKCPMIPLISYNPQHGSMLARIGDGHGGFMHSPHAKDLRAVPRLPGETIGPLKMRVEPLAE